MLKMRHVLFLACVAPAIGLCLADSASAVVRFKGAPSFGGHAGLGGFSGLGGGGPVRSFAGMRNGIGRMPGLGGGGLQVPHGGLRGVGGPGGVRLGHGSPHGPQLHSAQRGGLAGGPGGPGGRQAGGLGQNLQRGPLQHNLQRGPLQHNVQHGPQQHNFQRGPAGGRGGAGGLQPHGIPQPMAGFLARNGLPHRPFPGEAGFTGLPPQGETRFVSREMILHVGADVSPQTLEAAAHRLGLTKIESHDLSLSGGRLVHFRTSGDISDAIRSLETEKIGIAQPNYVFELQQDAQVAALPPQKGEQYVIDKLHLREAHTIASGANVTVAVIDSLIDTAHPDLIGSVVGQFDAVAATDKPDEHGTGMTGAIAAHRKLLGVAPRARILAIHAFTPDAKHPQQATTQSIVAGIDWAIGRGAKVINMSFAGPYDPMLQMALKKAREKGVVLVAAVGNMGPQSPPLYPAADENVIAVTAVDQNDALLPQANQGAHVALAAPGVRVWEVTPNATYNYTTGTSVAAAHVSGVAALVLERNPAIDAATLEDALYTSARDLGAPGRDPQFGYGLVDPYRALLALEAKTMVRNRRTPETTASATPRQLIGALSPPAASTANAANNPSPPKPPPGAAELVAGAPAGPIGPATPRVSAIAPSGTVAGRPPPPPPATPAALSPAATDAALIEKKREACRQAGANRGVEPAEMAQYVTVCVSEARITCIKQADAQKVRRAAERRDFINRCLQGS